MDEKAPAQALPLHQQDTALASVPGEQDFTAPMVRSPTLPPPSQEEGSPPKLMRLGDKDQLDRRSPNAPSSPKGERPAKAHTSQSPIPPWQEPDSELDERDISLFSTWLLREGYIERVSKVIPASWRTMSAEQLSTLLTQKYSQDQLKELFLEAYARRTGLKASTRRLSVISALVVGLIWARENIKEGEWGMVAAKIGASGAFSYIFNMILYARDLTPSQLMLRKAGNFSQWFKGAASTNPAVDFLALRVAPALLMWDLKDLFMSSGVDGPNPPFDVIFMVDIDDPSTWIDPPQQLLDLGFNVWYRQTPTANYPEAGVRPIYLGKVEGSLLTSAGKALAVLPQDVPQRRGTIYQIAGPWNVKEFILFSIESEVISPADNVLVEDTGRVGTELFSSLRGHYREIEVIPVNEAAIRFFGSTTPRFVPEYLLHQVQNP